MSQPRVSDILATLAQSGPATGWPARLVEVCRTATQVSGVGLAVMNDAGAGGVLASTGGHARALEDLQFTLGEGPCMDAARSGRPLLVPDLSGDAAHRWPAYVAGALSHGVLAAFTFPLRVGAIAIGVLDLYHTTRGPLSDVQLTAALAHADAASAVLLHLQYAAHPADHDGSRADVGPPDRLTELFDRRAVVHQAVG